MITDEWEELERVCRYNWPDDDGVILCLHGCHPGYQVSLQINGRRPKVIHGRCSSAWCPALSCEGGERVLTWKEFSEICRCKSEEDHATCRDARNSIHSLDAYNVHMMNGVCSMEKCPKLQGMKKG